jgi:hypothetical protein
MTLGSQASIKYTSGSKENFNYNSSATYGLEGAFCGEGQEENSQKNLAMEEERGRVEVLERQIESMCAEILKREIEGENRKKGEGS